MFLAEIVGASGEETFDEGSDIGSDVVEVFDEARIDNFGVTLAWLQDYLFYLVRFVDVDEVVLE